MNINTFDTNKLVVILHIEQPLLFQTLKKQSSGCAGAQYLKKKQS